MIILHEDMIIYDADDSVDPDDHADHDDPSETTLPFLLDHSGITLFFLLLVSCCRSVSPEFLWSFFNLY